MMFLINKLFLFIVNAESTTVTELEPFRESPVEIIENINTDPKLDIEAKDIASIQNISSLVAFFLFIVTGIGIAVVFVNLGLAFFGYISSSGEPKKLEKSNNHLIYTLIGLLIVLFSWTIRGAILRVIGMNPELNT